MSLKRSLSHINMPNKQHRVNIDEFNKAREANLRDNIEAAVHNGWLLLDTRTPFHQLISFILGRRVRYAVPRLPTGAMLVSTSDVTVHSTSYRHLAQAHEQVKTVDSLVALYKNNGWAETHVPSMSDLTSVESIDNWTLQAFQVAQYPDGDVLLSEDFYVRARICDYAGVMGMPWPNRVCDIVDKDAVLKGIPKTLLSRFFWSIKPEAVSKLKQNQLLTAMDFY